MENHFLEYMAKEIAKILGTLSGTKLIVLDGSIRTNEHIFGLSDIDLKVFFHSTDEKAFFSGVRPMLRERQDHASYPLNAWFLSMDEHPSFGVSTFDFVRSHVLRCGSTLYGPKIDQHILLPKCLSQEDHTALLRSMHAFLVRLRRLASNPISISDVKELSTELLLQQSCSYFVHTLRYYLATKGLTYCRLQDCFQGAEQHAEIADVVETTKRCRAIRQNWQLKKQISLEQAFEHLTSCIQAMALMRREASIFQETNLDYFDHLGNMVE